ncbi:hypothetical protein [Alkalimarinus alittae]|uniref:Uncharacterized protein n=1 Tax=Alkalimarinus alittae TaxID=2961619 RepID=A0ABY6N575_9ALTE|nr:hypothetical protein [Alkalimarinus alittae]UZE97266.1 hypothetical protein NKI27_05815 [Alkalimarinus alittae]
MKQQLPMLDATNDFEGSTDPDSDIGNILTEEEILLLKENLIVETAKSAFGLSRGGNKRKPSDEAWEWILSEDRELPFSFAACCREWNADPDKVLEGLRYYRRKLLS